jgi:hypothetical protein
MSSVDLKFTCYLAADGVEFQGFYQLLRLILPTAEFRFLKPITKIIFKLFPICDDRLPLFFSAIITNFSQTLSK